MAHSATPSHRNLSQSHSRSTSSLDQRRLLPGSSDIVRLFPPAIPARYVRNLTVIVWRSWFSVGLSSSGQETPERLQCVQRLRFSATDPLAIPRPDDVKLSTEQVMVAQGRG